MKNNYSKYILWTIALATLALIAYSFYISATVYSNVIIGRDEANFVLKSTEAMLSASNAEQWIDALFQIHAQHVLVGMQLANLFSYYTTGFINFQLINILGVFYLVIPTLLIIQKSKPDTTRFILLAAIIFPLALSPGHNTCAINVACTGNHYLGLGLAIVALYFFTATTTLINLFFAELFLAIAVFSSPAALVLVAIAFPVLLLLGKNKFFMLCHLGCSLVIVLIYHWAISRHMFEVSTPENGIDVFKMLLLMLVTFFRILGSVVFWSQGMIDGVICILLGLCITIIGLVVTYKQLQKIHNTQAPDHAGVFYLGGFVMMISMIALISLGRFYELGSTRYVFYSCFAIIFLLLAILHKLPQTHAHNITLALAIIFLLYYPLEYLLNKPYLDRVAWQITACEAQWKENHIACGVMIKHQEATDLLIEAQQRGILPGDLLAK